MKKCLVILFAIFIFNYGAELSQAEQTSMEQEIRGIFCQIENGDYAGAQNNLEKILQKEPQNIFARRLLPGVLAHRIKEDDKSPENIAQIRKTIEAYCQVLKIPKISLKEKTEVDDFIITLSGKIGNEEKTGELLKRVGDKNQTPQNRSKFYAMLADQPRICADEIVNPVFRENPPDKSEIEKAKDCVAKGLEYADQAIALDPNNEYAWSNKASLLSSASKIAELENDRKQKDLLKKQADSASRQFKKVAELKYKELKPNIPAGELSKTENFTREMISRELIEYKAEKPLDKLVEEVYIPFELVFIAPIPMDEESADGDSETVPQNTNNQKREWKKFSPEDDEIVAELPDNVSVESFSIFNEKVEQFENFHKNLLKATDRSYGEIEIYSADSEGVRYTILSQPKPSFQNANLDDPALNTLAWAFASNFSNPLSGNIFETKLLRKENIAGQPGRIYTYVLSSCSNKTDGTFLTLIGKKRNYVIDVRGAKLEDEWVQRFLKSIKIIDRD